MTDILPSHSITGGVFSPLTLFESTITNAQMLVESMAERELFSALRIIGSLHSHVVHVMEPRYGRLCERSDHLAELEASGMAQTAAAAAEAAASSATVSGARRVAKEEKIMSNSPLAAQQSSVLHSALGTIKMENFESAAADYGEQHLLEEPPTEILEEDADDEIDDEDDCVITDYFDDSSFGGGGVGGIGGFGPTPSKMPRYGGGGGGGGDSSMPAECKTIMRRAYKALKGNGPHLFDFSLPFSSDQNQRVAARVTAKAKEMAHGKGWPEDIWQKLPKVGRLSEIFFVFRSQIRNKLRVFKLNRRQKSFELVATSLTSEELEKFRVILTREYTSSDEECGSGGTDQLRVRELAWESDEVKRLKRQLDQVYSDNCATTKQKQQLARCIRDPMRSRSQRPPPEHAPSWALKVPQQRGQTS